MDHRLLFLGLVMGIVGGSTLVIAATHSPELSSGDLPKPTPAPSPLPSPAPGIRPLVKVRMPGPPRGLIILPTPTFQYAPNLNTDLDLYHVLNLTPAQKDAILHLRCAPAVPPAIPYPGYLEGCHTPNGAGIMYLDDIVEAGIMTVDEVNEVLNGHVYQTWRGR